MVRFTKPSDVIERLRTTIALVEAAVGIPPEGSFQTRVLGTGRIEEITESELQRLPRPCLLVSLMDTSTETTNTYPVHQHILHGFDIGLVLDTKDARQQYAEEKVPYFKEMLVYALNGWLPRDYQTDTGLSPFRFLGDIGLFSDKSSYVRLFSFVQDAQFSALQDGLGSTETELNLANFESFYADMIYTTSQTVPSVWDDTEVWDDADDWEDEVTSEVEQTVQMQALDLHD